MGQFSRFLQGVVVAKDKRGAYVPKKYIVRRHGSGYLNGSTEYLNDALDGDYQRLVTEHGLDELYAGKSVHKDFTATPTEDAFHLDALPKFILEKDGSLRLLSRGKYRIMECNPYVSDSVHITYQDDSGNFKQESISKEAWGSWLLARDYVPTFESNREQSKFIESIPIEVLMHGNDKFNLEASRMKLTNGDCAKIKVETSDGLEPRLAVIGFNKSENGVCRVNSQVDIVEISVASAISNGVAVLDLSSCEKLSKVSLRGAISEKFSVIFLSRHAKSLEISLDLSGSEYLVSVGEEAFAGTGLSKVMFGDKLREIKDRAFCLCDKLTDVSIPSECPAVKESGIEDSAFGACAGLSRDTIERLEALGINVYRGSSYIIWASMRSREFSVSKDEIMKCINPDNLYYLSKVYSLIDKYGEVPLRTRRVSDAFRRDINNVKAYREQYNKEVSEHRRTGASLSEEALENEYSAMCLFKQFDYITEDKL